MEKEAQKQTQEIHNSNFQNNVTFAETCSRTRIHKIYTQQTKKQAEEIRKQQEAEREK